MEPHPVLIVYATKHGQTRKIVHHLETRLRGLGVRVRSAAADDPGPGPEPAEGEVIVAASPIYFGRPRRPVVEWVRERAPALERHRGALLIVCGAAAGTRAEDRAQAERYLTQFGRRTRWSPDSAVAVGGAVRFTRYNPLLRWVMKRIGAKEGLSTDSTHDHEYTDWERVDALADHIAELAGATVAPAH